MNKIIKIENVNKTFKIRQNKNLLTGIFRPEYKFVDAVKNVSFDVREGEAVAFLGPNGAGKTTTTKMLTGLIHPTSGEIKVMGFTPFNRKNEFLKNIGLVMGNKTGLNWDLSPLQSFKLLKEIYKISTDTFQKNVKELTQLLDAEKFLETQVRKLSLGERMKMELIGSILHNPKILFLDEPTIGLDITSKKNIRIFLRKLQQERNITLLLTSHDMDDVEKVCDRVIIINKGAKIHDGSLLDLTKKYSSKKFITVYYEQKPQVVLSDLARIENETKDSVTYEVEKNNLQSLVAKIIESDKVLDIDIASPPLEDIIEDIF